MKRCIHCKKVKALKYFNTRLFGPYKKKCPRSYCKKCSNIYNIKWRKAHPKKQYEWDRNKFLKKLYGITQLQYEIMLKNQRNRCAICNVSAKKFKSKLAVDHNHKNGKVRGLLCVKCNTSIGSLKTKKLLKNAIKYFNKYGE